MLYAIVAVIALIIDQAVKYWATANIVLNTGTKEFIPGFIQFTNIHNTGAAFSILEGARWFFVILCLVFVALIVYVLITDIISAPGARWMAVIVMAGAIGNCIDRLICGYVVDMIEFEFMNFPVFNIADIYITVGAILFVVFTLLEKPKAKAGKAAKAPARAESEQAAPAKKPTKAAPAKKAGFELPSFGKKKTPIPDFPKREHKVESYNVDPLDPFAEWERRASQIKAANEAKPPVDYVKPQPPVAKAAPVKAEEQVYEAPRTLRPAVSYPSLSAEPQVKAAPAAPAAPKAAPAAPVAPAAPAAPKAEPVAENIDIDEFDFNIDDILAEFKDL
ncbi:MAG: signal peptidase II [Oscillospiraceae bacterium]|nr:signal peptidase II [Oscillospiraceae bacterium]